MILTPTCHLLRRPDGSYALALNEQGNDAAQIAAADLPAVARLLSMAAAFTLLGQQHDARPGLTVSSQPRSGGPYRDPLDLETPDGR